MSRKYGLKLKNDYFNSIEIDISDMFVFVIFSWWNFIAFFTLAETFWSLLLKKKKKTQQQQQQQQQLLVINKIVLLKQCLIFIFISQYPQIIMPMYASLIIMLLM